MLHKLARTLLVGANLTLAIPGIAGAAPTGLAAGQTPVRGGTLVVAVNPDPAQLSTAFHNQYANAVAGSNIFEGLVSYDKDNRAVPALATRWEVSDDGLSITFKLRSGVRWHDGKPFTSADVQYTALEVWKKVGPRARVTFEPLLAVDTPDASTAIFRLRRPAPVILNSLDAAEAPILPRHLYEGTDVRSNPVNQHPVGTGPFRFKEWKKSQQIILERNPDYWDNGKPYLDRVIFRSLPDSATRAAALETGEIQYQPFGGVPLADVKRLKSNPNLVFEPHGYEYNAQVFYLAFNLRRPHVDQVKVRKAIAYALDKQGLVDTVWHGVARTADSPIVPALGDFYAKDKPAYPYDPIEAEKLLDEAGLPRKPDGKRFTVKLDLSINGEAFPLAGEYIRQNLAKVGIDVKPVLTEQGAFLKRIWTDYDFDILFQGFSTLMDPELGLTRLVWSKAGAKGVPNVNAFAYASPRVDALIAHYQQELDPRKRYEAFHDLQRVLLTDLPLIPVMEAPYFTFYNKRVHGVDTSSDGARSSFKDAWIEP